MIRIPIGKRIRFRSTLKLRRVHIECTEWVTEQLLVDRLHPCSSLPCCQNCDEPAGRLPPFEKHDSAFPVELPAGCMRSVGVY